MKHHLLILCLLAFLLPVPVLAAPPPVPPNKKEHIDNLEEKLKAHKQQKQSLEEKTAEIENDLESVRKNLVKAGKEIQSNEAELLTLENKITDLEKRKNEIETTLENNKHSIGRLIMALQRLRRVPPEALMLKPGAPFETAQSAMLMEDIIPAIYKQANILQLNLEELETIKVELHDKKAIVVAKAQELETEYQKLSGYVGKKEKLYNKTNSDLKAQAAEVQKISLQAKNLQDLVKRIENERTQTYSPKTIQKTPVGKPGSAQLPISGIIKIGYNDADNFGAKSQGLTIEGRSGALITAPMGGTIRFAGYFKNYGNMVIIEHENSYHSLIAGLEKIDTVVGHTVSAGEPLGKLNRGVEGRTPTLYYELRRKGTPVNPSVKFAGLN